MKLFRATLADLARHLRIRATDAQRRGATACVSEPLPSLPLATLFYGRHSVSRPIEGLDSHGAVRTLRTASWLANGCASRRHRRRLNVAGRDLGFGVRSRISHDRRFGDRSRLQRARCKTRPRGGAIGAPTTSVASVRREASIRHEVSALSPASTSFGVLGRRRSCRGPRWAETRHLFQQPMPTLPQRPCPPGTPAAQRRAERRRQHDRRQDPSRDA